jgi:hypothetical protein
MAALPYQPSSVYFAQSIYHGEWLGKSALRCRVWSRAKETMKSSHRAVSQRFCEIVNLGFLT